MKLIAAFLGVFFTILTIQISVSAIRCYECTNVLGAECEKVNDGMIVNCTSAVSCIKSKGKSSAIDVTIRNCGSPVLLYNNQCNEIKEGELTGTICECSTDLCNGASSVVMHFTVFVPILIAIVVKHAW
ncbi:hypothetical protein ACKWTF_005161 [Chironomus riparius]